MKISHHWLKEFVDFESTPQQVSDTLNMLGIEVESFTDYASVYRHFVIGKVLSKEKHPKADKLSVCTVFDGNEEKTIVCGAPNVDAGQVVVVALPGAIVPNGGFEIAKRMLRGVESNGMICSKAELNLDEDHSGIWVLPDDTPVGAAFADAMNCNDVIYEISITPNRADALSHLGIARVIAAYENKPLVAKHTVLNESDKPITATVQIKDADLCPRYTARVIRNVRIGQSPEWMRQRLESLGLRPKNVVVDVTNYVLMELGQPLHAFDYSAIADSTIVVQRATQGEKHTTLDGKERTLDSDMLMICDSQKAVAIGGVMGGDNSSVHDGTTDILLESAYFLPSSIRRTAKKVGISSDASYRFERGVDILNIIPALDRAAQLIAELTGGSIEQGIAEAYPQPYAERIINLRFERARSIIGIEISDREILDLLTRLQFHIVAMHDQSADFRVPSFRVDVHQEIDLIEEIAILYNYDNITVQNHATISFGESLLPHSLATPSLRQELRNYFSLRGFHEVITQYQTDPHSASLSGEETIAIANPLGEELSVMRTSLIPSMLRVVRHNERNGASSLALYEIGKSFHKVPDGAEEYITGISEREELCVALHGTAAPKQWFGEERTYDFYDVKGIAEALFGYLNIQPVYTPVQNTGIFSQNALAISIGEVRIGTVGEIAAPLLKQLDIEGSTYILSVDMRTLYSLQRTGKKYQPISLFPAMQRDLSFVVEKKVHAQTILKIIYAQGGEYFRSARIFDIFEGKSIGEGKKSLSYAITFASDERTLTDAEADAAIAAIVKAVQNATGAVVRGA